MKEGLVRVESIGGATLYNADCREVLPGLSNIDLCVTSPPYNLGAVPWPPLGHWRPGIKSGSGGQAKWKGGANSGDGVQYGAHTDGIDWPDYVDWQKSCIGMITAALGDTGALFYNHKPRVIGGRVWLPSSLLPDEALLRQIVIWARPGGMNYSPVSFVPTHEWVMIVAKPAFRLKSRGASGIGDVWSFPPAKSDHPAPFPIDLPLRAIDATAPSSVLDPFMGHGTTGVAALRSGAQFYGCELDAGHFDAACRKLEAELRQPALI